MDKKLIINALMAHYKVKKYNEFADFLGIKAQVLSNWIARNTFDIELIYTKCVEINPDWLLTGKGEMLRNNLNQVNEPTENYKVATETMEVMREQIELLKENRDLFKEKAEILESKLKQCEADKKHNAASK